VTTFTTGDTHQLRQVLSTFPTGVTAIAALVDGRPVGMAVSSFTSVSLDPPMVLVCINRASATWPALAGAPMFGVSILAAGQQRACRQLSARSGDRFANLRWHATAHGAVVLDGAAAWLECSLESLHEAGDHDIVVLRVHDLDGDRSVAPLVFHGSGFRRLALEPEISL
jgi:flavin reductase (DIM6/NTAB) family NADH-FMN oxidoreductase RutF